MPRHGFSPQKDVRRSNRERHFLFNSLHENDIGLPPSAEPTYTSRSSRRIREYTDDYSDEDDDRTFSSRKDLRRRLSAHINNSPSYLRERSRLMPVRRYIDEDDDEENADSLYDRVKRNRGIVTRKISTRSNNLENEGNEELPREEEEDVVNGTEDVPKTRQQKNEKKRENLIDTQEVNGELNEEDEQDEEAKDEHDEEDEDSAPRQYQLRTRRPPPVQFSSTADERKDRCERRERSSRRRAMHTSNRRRIVRSDSDSTGDEEEKFERRKERSMQKHRGRFMPINMTEKELHASHHAILKERLQQSGGKSCSDLDPMSIDSEVGFDKVGGLGPHLQSLKEMVLFPMLYPEVFTKFDIAPPKGVIFYGPPGTGKTLVARALANECRKGANKVAFFMRKGADCLSKWVGESERQLRLLFDQAYQMRPSIIFFDEIDGLAPARSSKQDQIHASIVSTLLALMDGLDSRGEVVVIGATNRLDTIDPALRRPGRFDRELRFSLPDRNARKQILDIHTDKWEENKPTEETICDIADATSGFCGADLKYLCTEAVLIALRSRYPHIYMSKEKLLLETSSIHVTKLHFSDAMKRITPASRRDLTIPSKRLDERTSILLEDLVHTLIALRIPEGYRSSQSIEATGATELEKVVRALEKPLTVPSGRLLLTGSDLVNDLGQTSFVLPAILSILDHLPVFSLSVASLLTEGRPEEALSHALQAALRAAATGPCILLLPSIHQWEQVVPMSLLFMLNTFMNSLTGATPILLLGTLDSDYDSATDFAQDTFRDANCFQMTPPDREQKQKYFEYITKSALIPPIVFNEALYTAPPKAADSSEPVVTRKLNPAEARELEKVYESLQRQMRIFLRDKLRTMTRDRRFVDFLEPVDQEDAKDYYEIITNPLCMEQMMDKIDQKIYTHPDQFMDDIYLISENALEYNPKTTTEGRQLRHSAMRLKDFAEELFESELDELFVEQLETTSRLLMEAGVHPDREKLIEMPNGFVRKTPWSVKNKLRLEIEKWKAERAEAVEVAVVKVEKPEIVPEGKKVTKKRKRARGTYDFNNSRKKKMQKRSPVEEVVSEENEEEEMEDENDLSTASTDSSDKSETPKELKIDEEKLTRFVAKCIDKTEGWGVPELERLAAALEHRIEAYRDFWDRDQLVHDLRQILSEWEPRSR